MPNPHRGEIEAHLDGRPYTLCLTLGALAELEHAFGDEDMLALAERFQSGRLSARDAARIIGAGLRGAGHDIPDAALARMQADGGAAGFVDIVARLLSATFGVRPCGSDPMAPDPTAPTSGPLHPSSRKPRAQPEAIRDLAEKEVRDTPVPFHGPT
jgi:hypothetical protein